MFGFGHKLKLSLSVDCRCILFFFFEILNRKFDSGLFVFHIKLILCSLKIFVKEKNVHLLLTPTCVKRRESH